MPQEKKHIYPTGARQNYNAHFYSDIALRNYVRAKEQLVETDFSYDSYVNNLPYDLIYEYAVATIIFSTMCIEAYLNDYAAACLGDKEFYGYFDKLSIEGKFALISKFILSAEIDKGQSYYSRLKLLIKERNELMHSKSKEIVVHNVQTEEPPISDDMFLQRLAEGIDPTPYREAVKSAQNAILAIRDIALFFDKYDAAAHAVIHLFGLGGAILDKDGQDIRNDLLRELNLKNLVSVT